MAARKRSAAKRRGPAFFARRAVEMGASDARAIPASKVSTAEWVRLKCQFGCGGYGRALTCPPHSPTPERTRAMLREYRVAVLIHATERRCDIKKIVSELEREAFLDGYYKAFALGSGPCHLCKDCALDKGCRHPYRARPSMEACGIDVYRTARAAGFPIHVVTDHACPQNYYGLVLIE